MTLLSNQSSVWLYQLASDCCCEMILAESNINNWQFVQWIKEAYSWKGLREKVDEKSEKGAILKTLSRKSHLYCFIGLQMTKFKVPWHNFKKKGALLACFTSIFPLNKEEKRMKNWKSRPFREKTTFNQGISFAMTKPRVCSAHST